MGWSALRHGLHQLGLEGLEQGAGDRIADGHDLRGFRLAWAADAELRFLAGARECEHRHQGPYNGSLHITPPEERGPCEWLSPILQYMPVGCKGKRWIGPVFQGMC